MMVERLQIVVGGDRNSYAFTEAHADGDYVFYSDYADLERQIAELRAAHEKAVQFAERAERERDLAREYGKEARIRENRAEDARIHERTLRLAAEAENTRLIEALREYENPANWGVNARFDANSSRFDGTSFAHGILTALSGSDARPALPLKDEVERVLEEAASEAEKTGRDLRNDDATRRGAAYAARLIREAESTLLPRIRAGEQEGGKSVRETMWGEVIEGDDGEIVFRLCEEDNRDGPHEQSEITLLASTFPVGTRVSISEPAAPSEQRGDRQ